MWASPALAEAAGPPDACLLEEAKSEANLPAEDAAPGPAPWVSPPNVDTRRPPDRAVAAAARQEPAVGLTWRIRNRRTFDALREHGNRARRGVVTLVHLPSDDAPGSPSVPPQVAFAVGRRVGRAVERNRVRRQLRQIVGELVRQGRVPPGALLVIVRQGGRERSYHELQTDVAGALERLAVEVSGR